VFDWDVLANARKEFWLDRVVGSKHLFEVRNGSCAVLGHAHLSPSGSVWGVEVVPEYRGRGIGRVLMVLMIGEARRLGHPWVRVRVHATNLTAKRLYESMGFREVGVYGSDSRGMWSELELEIDEG
jgi:ribosomal protein S18 acetylase RimI-like enzyme